MAEDRQTRVRIGIQRFRGRQCGKDTGKTVRESPDRGENLYSTILGMSVWVRHGSDHLRIARPG